MKYDKYGDPIAETAKEFTSKQKVLFGIVIALQILMILANVLILVVPFLNLYLCFITAPAFLLVYISYMKACAAQREGGHKMAFHKVFGIVSPVLYVISAVLAILGGMQ